MNDKVISPTSQKLAAQIQQNIDNLYDLQFLFEAVGLLSVSLEYEPTLKQLAKLAVPRFADWCVIHIATAQGKTEQIVVQHVEPKKIKLALALQKEYPEDPEAEGGVKEVMKTGKSQMMSNIPESLVLASAKDAKHEKLLKELGLRSYISVPLATRNKVLGVITCVSAESGRVYTDRDLILLEDLARFAAIAVDNALLFDEAQKEIEKRKQIEREITALNKSLEKKVTERTEKLERSNRELQDFAYVASHDLQEPLRKIQAFGDLLKEEYGEKLGNGDEYVSRMLHAAGRMRVLIDDLLAFSRVTTKALPFKKVNLQQILDEVLLDLEMTIKQTKATISIKDKLPEIEADPLQMRQLFQNILSNSLKFHKDDMPPTITITSKLQKRDDKENTMCEIAIQDNGIGFDEKYLDRIFTIFERLHGKQDYAGTGIGLAVCRKIVERHRGSITAKSSPDKGTTFYLIIPIRQAKEVSTHE